MASGAQSVTICSTTSPLQLPATCLASGRYARTNYICIVNIFFLLIYFFSVRSHVHCTVCDNKEISLFSAWFNIFSQNFRSYSRHDLLLLLRILSFYLSFFTNNTAVNIKDDNFQLRRQINQNITNF